MLGSLPNLLGALRDASWCGSCGAAGGCGIPGGFDPGLEGAKCDLGALGISAAGWKSRSRGDRSDGAAELLAELNGFAAFGAGGGPRRSGGRCRPFPAGSGGSPGAAASPSVSRCREAALSPSPAQQRARSRCSSSSVGSSTSQGRGSEALPVEDRGAPFFSEHDAELASKDRCAPFFSEHDAELASKASEVAPPIIKFPRLVDEADDTDADLEGGPDVALYARPLVDAELKSSPTSGMDATLAREEALGAPPNMPSALVVDDAPQSSRVPVEPLLPENEGTPVEPACTSNSRELRERACAARSSLEQGLQEAPSQPAARAREHIEAETVPSEPSMSPAPLCHGRDLSAQAAEEQDHASFEGPTSPASTAAGVDDATLQTLRTLATELFARHDEGVATGRVPRQFAQEHVAGLFRKYRGLERELYERLCRKYGIQPRPDLVPQSDGVDEVGHGHETFAGGGDRSGGSARRQQKVRWLLPQEPEEEEERFEPPPPQAPQPPPRASWRKRWLSAMS